MVLVMNESRMKPTCPSVRDPVWFLHEELADELWGYLCGLLVGLRIRGYKI